MIPRTRWATTVDGASIAYQDFGSGSLPLVVIHGWVSHVEVYWEQPEFARFMHRLGRDFRVLHFDKRGVGMSDRLTGGAAPDLETRMDDVRAVLDAAGIDRAAVLGWGAGGSGLTFFFAATYPERTIAAVTDSLLSGRKTPDFPWGADEAQLEHWHRSVLAHWGEEQGARAFIEAGFGAEPGCAPPIDPPFIAWCAKFSRYAATPTSYAAFERVLVDTDERAVLSNVTAPVAVYYKTESPWPETKAVADYLAEQIPDCRLLAVPGVAGVIWVEDPEPVVSAVERFLDSAQRAEADLDRVLATVLFTDIVGSTETAARMGDHAWKGLVERHHAAIRALLARFRGRELDTAGDGFYAAFDGPARAVRCARAITDAMTRYGLRVRAGVHTGEVQVIDGKPGGIAVSIGARVAAQAGGDEVLVSQTVKDLVVGSGLEFEDRGEHVLKGVPGRWRLYAAVG